MYLSKIVLRRDAMPLSQLAEFIAGNTYHVHQFLWELFSDSADRKRDFLYRRKDESQWPEFYVLSEREPVDQRHIWEIATKPYAPVLKLGDRLSFILRANPIVTQKDKEGRRKRHDVVMVAKRRLQSTPEKLDKTIASNLIMIEGIKWLDSRSSAKGFRLITDSVRVTSYQQHHLNKMKEGRHIQFSTLDLQGLLIVTDVETFFYHTLYKII